MVMRSARWWDRSMQRKRMINGRGTERYSARHGSMDLERELMSLGERWLIRR
jgi:hypothetical protein